jgi:hypothetical protein
LKITVDLAATNDQTEVKIRKGTKKPDRKIYQVRLVSKLSPEYFETQSEVKQKMNM